MNIYVGNLPRTSSEDDVRSAFSAYGEVSEVKLIKDQYSGELRGFGFVEMPTKSEAEDAIEKMNGTELGGRRLVVNEARPRNDRNGGGGGRGGNRGGGGSRW